MSSSSIAPNHNIFFNQKLSVFQCKARVLAGLCPTLKKLFYPDFRFLNAVRIDCEKVEVTQISSSSSSSKKKKKKKNKIPKTRKVPVWIAKKWQDRASSSAVYLSSSASASSSLSSISSSNLSTGIRLDKEVDALIELVKKLGCSVKDVFYACSGRMDVDTLKPVVSNWLPHTKALVKFLYNNQWEPVASQLVVGDESLGVATKLDLLCMDHAKKKYIIIENKVGYDYLECNTKGVKMNWPFIEFDDSVRNQQHLQLLSSTALFERTFPSIPSTQILSVLVRYKTPYAGSSDVSLEVEPLDESIAKCKGAMIQVLKEAAG